MEKYYNDAIIGNKEIQTLRCIAWPHLNEAKLAET